MNAIAIRHVALCVSSTCYVVGLVASIALEGSLDCVV